MRGYIGILAGSLLLLGSSAVMAAPQGSSSLDASPTLRLAANDDWAAKKQEYEQKAQQEIDEWRHKMDQMTAEAKAKSQQLDDKAQKNLDRAWADAKVEWEKLKQASADNWDKARASFEDASARMKHALHDLQSNNP